MTQQTETADFAKTWSEPEPPQPPLPSMFQPAVLGDDEYSAVWSERPEPASDGKATMPAPDALPTAPVEKTPEEK